MLRSVARLPLRRCLHTTAASRTQARSRAGLIWGASAVAATYMTWRLTSERHHIALDAPSNAPTDKLSSKPKKVDSTKPILAPASETPANSTQDLSTSSSLEGSAAPLLDSEAGEQIQQETENTSSGGGGAYDPVTGEINWDCPCLGGMAYGPCGEEFREAFSCFIHSDAEPKGINCVEKFQAMQTCFRAHPEVYADEIMDDDEEEVPQPAEGGKEGLPIPVGAGDAVAVQEPAVTTAVSEFAPEPKEAAPSTLSS